MKLATILVTPLRASPRGARLSGVLVGITALVALLLAVFMQRPNWPIAAGAIIAFGEFFAGMFLLAPGLLLAVDGRQLRIPGLERAAVLGIACAMSAMIAVPSAALGLAGGPATDIACLLALAVIGGLMAGLIPRLLCAPLGLLPMAWQTVGPQLYLPAPGTPGFIPLALVVLVAMLALCALCWWRQLHAAQPYRQSWWQPMVLQLRHASHSAWSGLSGGLPDSVQQLRQQPDWLKPMVDLRPAGPRQPRYSLRVALGGPFVPLTVAARVRQLAVTVLPGLLLMALLTIRTTQRHGSLSWQSLADGAGMFVWFGSLAGLLAGLLAVMQLDQRWRKHNGELPLLALLPGLGAPQRRRRELLAASLLPGATIQLGVLAVLSALVMGLHLGRTVETLVLLVQLAGLGMLVAFTLAILGGRPLSGWVAGIVCVTCFVLVSLSLFWSLMDGDGATTSWPMALTPAWVIFLLVLAWIGRRGWRGLMDRPHPFFANAG